MALAAAHEAAASKARGRAKTNFMVWSFQGVGSKEGNAADNLRINAIMKRDFGKGTNGVISYCVRHCCGGLCHDRCSNGRADLIRNRPLVLTFITFLAIKSIAFSSVKKRPYRIAQVPA